jgi:hypothetical protein
MKGGVCTSIGLERDAPVLEAAITSCTSLCRRRCQMPGGIALGTRILMQSMQPFLQEKDVAHV